MRYFVFTDGSYPKLVYRTDAAAPGDGVVPECWENSGPGSGWTKSGYTWSGPCSMWKEMREISEADVRDRCGKASVPPVTAGFKYFQYGGITNGRMIYRTKTPGRGTPEIWENNRGTGWTLSEYDWSCRYRNQWNAVVEISESEARKECGEIAVPFPHWTETAFFQSAYAQQPQPQKFELGNVYTAKHRVIEIIQKEKVPALITFALQLSKGQMTVTLTETEAREIFQ